MKFLNIDSSELFKNNTHVIEVDALPQTGERNAIYHVAEFDYKKAFDNNVSDHPKIRVGCYNVKPQISEAGYKVYYIPSEDGTYARFMDLDNDEYVPDVDLNWDTPLKVIDIFMTDKTDYYFELVGYWDTTDYIGETPENCDLMITNDYGLTPGIKVHFNPRACDEFRKDGGLWMYTWADKQWVRLDNTSDAKAMFFFKMPDILKLLEDGDCNFEQNLFRVNNFFGDDEMEFVDFKISAGLFENVAPITFRYFKPDETRKNDKYLKVVNGGNTDERFLLFNLLNFKKDSNDLIVSAVSCNNYGPQWSYFENFDSGKNVYWFVEVLQNHKAFDATVMIEEAEYTRYPYSDFITAFFDYDVSSTELYTEATCSMADTYSYHRLVKSPISDCGNASFYTPVITPSYYEESYHWLFSAYCEDVDKYPITDSLLFKITRVDEGTLLPIDNNGGNIYELSWTRTDNESYTKNKLVITPVQITDANIPDLQTGEYFGCTDYRKIAIFFSLFYDKNHQYSTPSKYNIQILKNFNSGYFHVSDTNYTKLTLYYTRGSGLTGFCTFPTAKVLPCKQQFTSSVKYTGDWINIEYGAWFDICHIRGEGKFRITLTNKNDNKFTSYEPAVYEFSLPSRIVDKAPNIKGIKINEGYDSVLGENGTIAIKPAGSFGNEDYETYCLSYINSPIGLYDHYEKPCQNFTVKVENVIDNNNSSTVYFYDYKDNIEFDGTVPLPDDFANNIVLAGSSFITEFFKLQSGLPGIGFANNKVEHYTIPLTNRHISGTAYDSPISVESFQIFEPLIEAASTTGLTSVIKYTYPNTVGPFVMPDQYDRTYIGYCTVEAFFNVIIQHAYMYNKDNYSTGYVGFSEFVRSVKLRNEQCYNGLGASGIAGLPWSEWTPVLSSATTSFDELQTFRHKNYNYHTRQLLYTYEGLALDTYDIKFKNTNGDSASTQGSGLDSSCYIHAGSGYNLQREAAEGLRGDWTLTGPGLPAEGVTFDGSVLERYILHRDTSVIPEGSISVEGEEVWDGTGIRFILGNLCVHDNHGVDVDEIPTNQKYSHATALPFDGVDVSFFERIIERYDEGPVAIYLAGTDSAGEPIKIWPAASDPFVGSTWQDDGEQGFVPAPKAGDNFKVIHGNGKWMDPTAGLSADDAFFLWDYDPGYAHSFAELVDVHFKPVIEDLESHWTPYAKRGEVFAFPACIHDEVLSSEFFWGGAVCESTFDRNGTRISCHWTFKETISGIMFECDSIGTYEDVDASGIRNYNDWYWTPWKPVEAGFVYRKTYLISEMTRATSYTFSDMYNRFIKSGRHYFVDYSDVLSGTKKIESIIFPATIDPDGNSSSTTIDGIMYGTVEYDPMRSDIFIHWKFICEDDNHQTATYESTSYTSNWDNPEYYSDWSHTAWIQTTGNISERAITAGTYTSTGITTVTTDKLIGRIVTDIDKSALSTVGYSDLAPYFPISIRSSNAANNDRVTLELPTSFTLGSSEKVITYGKIESICMMPDKPLAVCSLGYTLGVVYNHYAKRIEILIFLRLPVNETSRYWNSGWRIDAHSANGHVITNVDPRVTNMGNINANGFITNYNDYLTNVSIYSANDCNLWYYGSGGELYDSGSATSTVTTITPSYNLNECGFNFLRRDLPYYTEGQNEQVNLAATKAQKLFTILRWDDTTTTYGKWYYVRIRAKAKGTLTTSSEPSYTEPVEFTLKFLHIQRGIGSLRVQYNKLGNDCIFDRSSDTCTFIIDSFTPGFAGASNKPWWGASILVNSNCQFAFEVIDASPELCVFGGSYKSSVFDLTSNASKCSKADWVQLGSGVTIKRLTQAEYDAITTKDANTIYIIT